jgi:hypothetical protein
VLIRKILTQNRGHRDDSSPTNVEAHKEHEDTDHSSKDTKRSSQPSLSIKSKQPRQKRASILDSATKRPETPLDELKQVLAYGSLPPMAVTRPTSNPGTRKRRAPSATNRLTIQSPRKRIVMNKPESSDESFQSKD